MTDSNYDDNGLISNLNDDFDAALHQNEKIQFKPLQSLIGISLDTGLTTDLDDDLFDDTDDPDLNWQPDLVDIDDISNVPLTADVVPHGPVGYAVDIDKGMNYPTGNQVNANNYNVPVQPTQATDIAANQNTQAAMPTANAQDIAAPVGNDTQAVAPVQAATPPIENNVQVTDDFDLDDANSPVLNASAEFPTNTPIIASQNTTAPDSAPVQSSQTVQSITPDNEPEQATDDNQEAKAETLANGTTVVWPGGSHIKMGKNAHPVTQNSEPVKSVAETIKEAKEAASYFNDNSNDDIALDPNNKSQLIIHHDNNITVPKDVPVQQKSTAVLQRSKDQPKWQPAANLDSILEVPEQNTRPLSQVGNESVANANASAPDVDDRDTFSVDQPVGEDEGKENNDQAVQPSSPVNSQADAFIDETFDGGTTTDENGLIETSDDFLAGDGAGTLVPLKPDKKATATHISNLDHALKTPIDDIASQLKAQPEDQNGDDFYDGLDQVADDPSQYERKDFVDMDPDTHEINITHAFRKQKQKA